MSERVAVVEPHITGAKETAQIDYEIDSGTTLDHAKYMYVRENGTVEKANNPEEIAQMCPALGKLAIEAPEQFDAMLALSEMTSQRIATESKPKTKEVKADTKKEAPVAKEPAAKQKDEKIEPLENTAEDATPKTTAQSEQSIIRQEDAKRYTKDDLQVDSSQYGPEIAEGDIVKSQIATKTESKQQAIETEAEVTADDSKIIKETASTSDSIPGGNDTIESFAVPPTEQIQTLESKVVPHKTEIEALNRNETKTSIVEISEQAPTPEQSDSHTLEPVQTRLNVRVASSKISPEDSFPDNSDVDTKDRFADELLIGDDSEEVSTVSLFTEDLDADDNPFTVDSYDLIDDAHELLFSDEALDLTPDEEATSLLDDARELLFGDEIIESITQAEDDHNLEVFDEVLDEKMQNIHDTLLELISVQEIDACETKAVTDVDVAPAITEETEQTKQEQSLFENYLEQTDATVEETLTYETITEHTENKPVEETFVELVQMLSNPEEHSEELVPGTLIEILEDIEQVLDKYYYHEDKKIIIAQPELTPALTKQLVLLLGELGYLDPKEALTKMMQQYNLTFLLQALGYLCKLRNEDERQEFLIHSKAHINQQDDARTRKVSKLIALVLARILRPGFSTNEA